MPLLSRTDSRGGWTPNADAQGAPATALLRADNLVLEEGVPTLRRGATVVATYGADLTSLYTAVLSGTRYRLAQAGSTVYVNGSSLATMAGSGDVSYGSAFGQLLFARSTTTKKYDGTSLRTWGVPMTGAAPTVATVASDGKTFTAGTTGGGAAVDFVQDEGDDETPNPIALAVGYDTTANGATAFWTKPSTNRAVVTHQMGAPTSFLVYDAGATGTADDLVTFYLYCEDPAKLVNVQLLIDVNAANFREDWYEFTWTADQIEPVGPPAVPISTSLQGTGLRDVLSRALPFGVAGLPLDRLSDGLATYIQNHSTVRREADSWSKLTVRRGAMTRVGSTSAKDWATVGAVRVIVTTTASMELRLDQMRMIQNTLSGTYKWCYVWAFNSGTYVGLSAPSPLSAETQILGQAATVTLPAGAGGGTECWLFRMGGILDRFYRVAVLSSTGGAVTDQTTDVAALTADIRLEADNTVPPANIIGIAGPYYDRTMCLTSDGLLWPSRRRNPDSFATGQAIRIAGVDETVYWIKQALGGLYVGTSKDIYRISGTGAELPDGTVDFLKEGLNLDHPPTTDAVAQDGNLLIYLGVGGWRAISGGGSQALAGPTSLLYQGQRRHGVGPVNLATGRFRATIGHGQLLATTPEGSETTSTGTIYRFAPAVAAAPWSRTIYPTTWRSILTEPDGTILAGDTTGQVWQLDDPNATSDGGTAVAVTLWTPVDDDGQPFVRKDPQDLRVSVATGTGTASVALHIDGSPSALATITAGTTTGQPPTLASLAAYAATPFRSAQLRVTGSCLTGSFVWRWYGWALGYHAHPPIQAYIDVKPGSPSLVRRRFAGLNVQIDTLGLPATVTPVLDGAQLPSFSVTTSQPLNQHVDVPNAVGRDLWGTVSSATGFELVSLEPIVVQTLPPAFNGLTAPQTCGSDGVKVVAGIQVRVCTRATARTFTVLVDGLIKGTFTVTSPNDDPVDYTWTPTAPIEGVEFQLAADSNLSHAIELYAWSPIITARRPLGVQVFDSGPIDLSNGELTWIRRLDVAARATATITVDVYLDGRLLATETSAAVTGADTVIPIDLPRGVKGRQPRIVLRSADPFFPRWVRITRRPSGFGSAKPILTVPLSLGEQPQGVA